MIRNYGNFINGKFDLEGSRHDLRSPADGSVIASITMGSREKTLEAIDAAYDSFHGKWLGTSLAERKKLLSKLADRIMERSDEYAMLESLNTGKTIRQSMLMDVPLGIDHIRYFATNGEFTGSRNIIHPEYPDTDGEIQYAPWALLAQ